MWPLNPQTPSPVSPDGSLPVDHQNVLDPLETLTYIAANTNRIILGTSVIDMLFHNPVILAKRFATLDVLSEGRIIAGLALNHFAKRICFVIEIKYQDKISKYKMSSSSSRNYADLIGRVGSIRNSYADTRRDIISQFPRYDIDRDIRVNIFSKCVNALDGLHLGMIFYNNHLTDPDWWTETASRMNLREPPGDNKLDLVENFAIFLKIAFIQTFVSSALESSIRSIALSVNEEEYRKAEHSFKKVYGLLLSEASLQASSNQYEALLDVLRCIRNANHDNGVYYGRNEDIEYRGAHYSFRNERRITFLTWDLLLDFSSELKDLIRDLVISDKVHSPEKIEDFSVL